MTTTGTYSYNPVASSLTLSSFARIGIRRTELTAQHLADAEQEANLVQVEISNRIPNLFANELYSQALTSGTETYTLPSRLVAFQAAYLATTSGGVTVDRLLFPLSAYEYASLADKDAEGPPTSYYLNTIVPPEITFWPVPDDNATYTFKVRMLRQLQDASLISGATLDMPYRWLDVWVAKLAHRLSRVYARDLEQQRRADAEEAWTIAATTDKEQVPIYFNASLSAYW